MDAPGRCLSPLWRSADRITGVALILIVEDEASVAELIAETLIQQSHEARVAVSAAHASLIVSTERPDLIPLDINLPDSSGTFALGRLRELRPDVPINHAHDEYRRRVSHAPHLDAVSASHSISIIWCKSSRSHWRHRRTTARWLHPSLGVRRREINFLRLHSRNFVRNAD